jgi:hypothetical protein
MNHVAERDSWTRYHRRLYEYVIAEAAWGDRSPKEALSSLIGTRLSKYGRAIDMLIVQFGELRTLKQPRGRQGLVGQFALHVQCCWRVRKGSKLLVGSNTLVSMPRMKAKPSGNETEFSMQSWKALNHPRSASRESCSGQLPTYGYS